MNSRILMICCVLTLGLAVAASGNAQSQPSQTQSNNPGYNQSPGYNYRQHSYDTYQNSAERYNQNPTQQNYQIMQQRQQEYEIRDRQYQQNGWAPYSSKNGR